MNKIVLSGTDDLEIDVIRTILPEERLLQIEAQILETHLYFSLPFHTYLELSKAMKERSAVLYLEKLKREKPNSPIAVISFPDGTKDIDVLTVVDSLEESDEELDEPEDFGIDIENDNDYKE